MHDCDSIEEMRCQRSLDRLQSKITALRLDVDHDGVPQIEVQKQSFESWDTAIDWILVGYLGLSWIADSWTSKQHLYPAM